MILGPMFIFSGFGFLTISLVLWLAGRTTESKTAGLGAVASGLMGIGCLIEGLNHLAVWNAAMCAWEIHTWWNGDGGSSFRKRLKKWGRSFKGTRRTAP